MSMLSTRGAAAVSESMAILRGLAPDGGLYVPEDFPHFSMEEIAALGALDYQARALAILQKFLPDFTADELKNAIAGAYGTGFDDIKAVDRHGDCDGFAGQGMLFVINRDSDDGAHLFTLI